MPFPRSGKRRAWKKNPILIWTDRAVLEKLLPMAQDLIETDRTKGDTLYEIFKYLEERLEQVGGDPAGAKVEKNKEQLQDPEIQETVKKALDKPRRTINII